MQQATWQRRRRQDLQLAVMAVNVLGVLQVEERGKLVCQPEGFHPALEAEDVTVSICSLKASITPAAMYIH